MSRPGGFTITIGGTTEIAPVPADDKMPTPTRGGFSITVPSANAASSVKSVDAPSSSTPSTASSPAPAAAVAPPAMSVQRGGFTISFGGGGGLSDAAKTAVETPVKTQQEQEKKEKDKKNKEKPNKAKSQTDERQEFGSGRVVVVEDKKEVGNTSTKPKTPKQKQQQQQQQQPQQKQIDELQSPTGRVVIIEPAQQPSSVDISMLPFDTRRRLQQEQSRVGGKSMFNSTQLNIINGTLGNGATGGGGGGFKGNSGGKGPPVVVRKEFDREERNKPPVAAPRAPAPPPKQQQQQQQKQQQQQRQQVMPPPPAQASTSRQPRPDRRGPQTQSSSELDFPPPFAVPLPPPPVSSGESLKPFRATKSWGDEDD